MKKSVLEKQVVRKELENDLRKLFQLELVIDFFGGDRVISEKEVAHYSEMAAKLGDHIGIVNYAFCLSEGIGLKKDYRRAVYWLKKIDISTIPEVHYNLAMHYEKGQGVRVNSRLAFKNYKKSASLNYPEGILAVGWCYGNRFGVKKNYRKEIYYNKKAAKLGQELGFLNLALSYLKGRGVKKTLRKAKYYFSKEELKNHPKAIEALKKL